LICTTLFRIFGKLADKILSRSDSPALPQTLKVPRFVKNIFDRFPFLKENTLQGNVIFLLGVITFILITIDLQTELAIEKNEALSVCELTDQYDDTVTFDTPDNIKIDLPFVSNIFYIQPNIIHVDSFTCLKDRAPPSLI
jgi:hypothetical protein